MSAYADLLAKHLAEYKRTALGVSESGVWRRNQRAYEHILPQDLADLNILEYIRQPFAEHCVQRSLKRHADFQHLSSSQAFAANVFFPFRMVLDQSAPLVQALGYEDIAAEIELESILDASEGSNLDVVIHCQSGRRLVIEVKLTEGAFGACRADAPHRAKRLDVYMPRLAGKVRPAALSDEVFFTHYQLLRNISYADRQRGQVVIFFLPRANGGLRSATQAFLEGFLEPDYRSLVRIVYAEDVLSQLVAAIRSPEWLARHLAGTASKYMLLPPHN